MSGTDGEVKDFAEVLPPEVTLLIFSFLDPSSLVRGARVSKQWFSFANDCYLWRSIARGAQSHAAVDVTDGSNRALTGTSLSDVKHDSYLCRSSWSVEGPMPAKATSLPTRGEPPPPAPLNPLVDGVFRLTQSSIVCQGTVTLHTSPDPVADNLSVDNARVIVLDADGLQAHSPLRDWLSVPDSFTVHRNAWKDLCCDLAMAGKNRLSLFCSAIEESSCDHQSQSIHECLVPTSSFWSSTGSDDVNSSEHLVFKLVHPYSVVRSVNLNVYKARFQADCPIYAPQKVQISVGFSPTEYHYTTAPIPVHQIEDTQSVVFDQLLVVGSYVRIDLIGRTEKQPVDDLWYTVLRRASAIGFPLAMLTHPRLSMCGVAYPTLARTIVRNCLRHPTGIRSCEDCFVDPSDPTATTTLKRCVVGAATDDELEGLVTTVLERWSEGIEVMAIRRSVNFMHKHTSKFVEIKRHIVNGEFAEAARRVAKDIYPGLRLPVHTVVEWLRVAADELQKKGDTTTDPEWEFFIALARATGTNMLPKLESVALVRRLIERESGDVSKCKSYLTKLCWTHKLKSSEELGDLLRVISTSMALRAYQVSRVHTKVCECYIDEGRFAVLPQYCFTFYPDANFGKLLRRVARRDRYDGLRFGLTILNINTPSDALLEGDEVAAILELDMGDEWDVKKVVTAELRKGAAERQ